MRAEGLDFDPKTGEYNGGEGTVYKVQGTGTPSGKPYIGTADDLDVRTQTATDGRDRTQATRIGGYPIGNTSARRTAEQAAIDDHGGIKKLDNKRNEIKKTPTRRKGR
jgi:hypothetical protein